LETHCFSYSLDYFTNKLLLAVFGVEAALTL